MTRLSNLGIILFSALIMAQGQTKPDLVIEDSWFDSQQGSFFYRLSNRGGAVAPQGHHTQLILDGQILTSDLVTQPMEPGTFLVRGIGWNWSCSGGEDLLVWVTDALQVVFEENEANNQLQESWPCDRTPPTFVLPPYVESLGTDTAKIRWESDEPCTAVVHYDTHHERFSFFQQTALLQQGHIVELIELEPGTAYEFRVTLMDASQNETRSQPGVFLTNGLAPSSPPQWKDLTQRSVALPYRFEAVFQDFQSVSRVSFSVDGQVQECDYAPPFEMMMDPMGMGWSSAQFYSTHTIQATAFDALQQTFTESFVVEFPGFCFPAGFEFRSPDHQRRIVIEGDSVPLSTPPVVVWVRASAIPFEQRTNRYGFTMEYSEPVERIDVYLNDTLVTSASHTTEIYRDWEIAGLPLGTYDWRAVVFNGVDCVPLSRTHRVIISQPEADLQLLSRWVTREGTGFDVNLQVANVGTGPAVIQDLYDPLQGFALVGEASLDAQGAQTYDPNRHAGEVHLHWAAGKTVNAGQTVILSYRVLPVMHSSVTSFSMGSEPTRVSWLDQDASPQWSNHSLPWIADVTSEVTQAIAAADYLSVTAPRALMQRYHDEEVFSLLAVLAELTDLRSGVMAYFDTSGLVRTNFDGDDVLVAGNLFRSSWDDELYLLDEERRCIRSYDETSELTLIGELPIERAGITHQDQLAVGNVWPRWMGLEDPGAEIIYFDGHSAEGQMVVYHYDSLTRTFSGHAFDSPFTPGATVLCGDLMSDTGRMEDELLILPGLGRGFVIYDEVTTRGEIMTDYAPGDPVALGHLAGDLRDELVFADISEGHVVVQEGMGGVVAMAVLPGIPLFASEDALVVGAFLGSGFGEQLLYADASQDRVTLFSFDPVTGLFSETWRSPLPFDGADALLVGEFLDTNGEELAVARGRRQDHRLTGDVAFFNISALGPLEGRHELDALINPGGAWARQLMPTWLEDGYLLFVGEIQILPAFSTSYEISGDREVVRATDHSYANTSGTAKRPELAMGRIVGDNPGQLKQPIQKQIDILQGRAQFSEGEALVVSGRNSGVGGGADTINFTRERWDVEDRLSDGGFAVTGREDPSEASFFAAAMDKDVIHYAAHGNEGSCDVLDVSEILNDFDPGEHAPLVYLNACLTGYYAHHSNTPSEAFLEAGAAAVLANSEVSYFPYGKYLAQGFYDRFKEGQTVGQAMKGAKRNRMGDTNYAKKNSAIMHLFGDPKMKPTTEARVRESSPGFLEIKEPDSSFSVQIPSPTVVSDPDGTDHVLVEGGFAYLEEGQPVVPSYGVDVILPQGTAFRGVTLIARDQVLSLGALNLPMADALTYGGGKTPSTHASALRSPEADFWPRDAFHWQLEEQSDGRERLHLDLFPLVYHRGTSEGTFYQSYFFSLETQISDHSWKMARAQKDAYQVGETVHLNCALESLEVQQSVDLLARGRIHDESGTPVGFLPLVALPEVPRLATWVWTWDTQGMAPGQYDLTLEVCDDEGKRLTQRHLSLTLAGARVRGLSLGVNPPCYAIDDPLEVKAVYENMGQVEAVGFSVLTCRDRQGTIVLERLSPEVHVAPGAYVLHEESWQVSVAPEDLEVSASFFSGGVASPALTFVVPVDVMGMQQQLPLWPSQAPVTTLVRRLICPDG